MSIAYRTAGADDRYIPIGADALDERRIPSAASVTTPDNQRMTVWWLTDEHGHVTEIVEDQRRLMRGIHSK